MARPKKWDDIRDLRPGQRHVYRDRSPLEVAKGVTWLRSQYKMNLITRLEGDGVHVICLEKKVKDSENNR